MNMEKRFCIIEFTNTDYDIVPRSNIFNENGIPFVMWCSKKYKIRILKECGMYKKSKVSISLCNRSVQA